MTDYISLEQALQILGEKAIEYAAALTQSRNTDWSVIDPEKAYYPTINCDILRITLSIKPVKKNWQEGFSRVRVNVESYECKTNRFRSVYGYGGAFQSFTAFKISETTEKVLEKINRLVTQLIPEIEAYDRKEKRAEEERKEEIRREKLFETACIKNEIEYDPKLGRAHNVPGADRRIGINHKKVYMEIEIFDVDLAVEILALMKAKNKQPD